MDIDVIDRAIYQLEKSEHIDIFSRIEKRLLQGIKSQKNPFFIIVGGQPGCGKSTRCDIIRSQLPESEKVLVVNIDQLRHYHPKYNFLNRQNDKLAALYTGQDAGVWADMLINKAARKRYNMVYESTLKNTEVLLFITKELKEKAGYDVSLQIMIVKPEFSQVSTYLRYEQIKAAQGYGRYVIPKYHDDSFNNIPKALQAIKEQGLVSKIELYTRDKPLFQGDYRKENIVAIANAEYNRPLTPEEKQCVRESWDDVQRLMLKRNCQIDELKEIIKQHV
jgi:UDP-N-acetylglucosamine kinase